MRFTINEIRLWNARALADKEGTIALFGKKINKSQTQAGSLIGLSPTRNIGNKIARQIEAVFNKPDGWLDLPHQDQWASIKRTEWLSQLRILRPNETDHASKEMAAIVDENHRLLNKYYLTLPIKAQEQIVNLVEMLSTELVNNRDEEELIIQADDFQGEADELTKKKGDSVKIKSA